MNNKGRVLFITGSMRRGGAERVISILANQYAMDGWKVKIITLLFFEVEYELVPEIEVVSFVRNDKTRLRNTVYWIKSIKKYIQEYEPSVIVSFAARINILSMVAGWKFRKKIIVSERNDPRKDGRGIVTIVAARLLYPFAKCVIFQTERAQKYFCKQIQRNSEKIYNPIKVYALSKDNNKKNRIVTAGRLTKQKNHRMLIDAFYKISLEFPEYELWIYGRGELEEEIKKQIQLYGLENRVFLPGNVEDIHEQMSYAKVFVLSSDYEGMSNALMEAMMMGLPCISTDCAGSDELIVNEKNGLLVSVGNTEEMAEAIRRIISDNKFAEKLAMEGQNFSKEFCVENVLDKWRNVIEK